MNRVGQQQPQQRPQNLPPAPGMAQFNRQLYPTGYSNVPPRNTIPQSYPTIQQHRPQSILPQTPGFMQRGGTGFFGPNQVIGSAGLQPSPNPPHPSLQQSQNSVQQLQQPQSQHQQPSATSNGLSQHLSTPVGGQSGTGTPANANSTGNTTSDSALDPNDFPALGSGTGAQPSVTSTLSGGNIHTSYASQAGTAISGGPGSIASSVNGPTSALRDFRPEDFPALGGPTTSTQQQQAQNSQGQQDIQSEPNQGPQSGLGGLPLSGQSGMPPGINPVQAQSRPGNYLKMGQSNLWPQPQPNNASFPPHMTNGMGQSNHGLPPGVPISSSFNGQPQQAISQIHQIPHSDALSNISLPTPPTSQPGHQPPASNQTALPQTPAQQILLSAADRWGLLSLLASIKGSDPDAQLLAIGSDLSGIGLDMNTNGNLYSAFITPWSDSSAALSIEPDFHLPACYNVSTPAPGPAKAASFSDETLFFMFYSSPRDTLQEIAAQELHNRNWRFHKEARLWLTKESGQTPFQKGATFERGTYTFFDPEAWEKTKREATIYYEQLEDRSTVPPPITSAGLNSVPPQIGMSAVGIPGMPPMGLQSGPGVNVAQMQQQPLGMRG